MIGETKMKPLLQAFLLFNVKPLLSHHTIWHHAHINHQHAHIMQELIHRFPLSATGCSIFFQVPRAKEYQSESTTSCKNSRAWVCQASKGKLGLGQRKACLLPASHSCIGTLHLFLCNRRASKRLKTDSHDWNVHAFASTCTPCALSCSSGFSQVAKALHLIHGSKSPRLCKSSTLDTPNHSKPSHPNNYTPVGYQTGTTHPISFTTAPNIPKRSPTFKKIQNIEN